MDFIGSPSSSASNPTCLSTDELNKNSAQGSKVEYGNSLAATDSAVERTSAKGASTLEQLQKNHLEVIESITALFTYAADILSEHKEAMKSMEVAHASCLVEQRVCVAPLSTPTDTGAALSPPTTPVMVSFSSYSLSPPSIRFRYDYSAEHPYYALRCASEKTRRAFPLIKLDQLAQLKDVWKEESKIQDVTRIDFLLPLHAINFSEPLEEGEVGVLFFQKLVHTYEQVRQNLISLLPAFLLELRLPWAEHSRASLEHFYECVLRAQLGAEGGTAASSSGGGRVGCQTPLYDFESSSPERRPMAPSPGTGSSRSSSSFSSSGLRSHSHSFVSDPTIEHSGSLKPSLSATEVHGNDSSWGRSRLSYPHRGGTRSSLSSGWRHVQGKEIISRAMGTKRVPEKRLTAALDGLMQLTAGLEKLLECTDKVCRDCIAMQTAVLKHSVRFYQAWGKRTEKCEKSRRVSRNKSRAAPYYRCDEIHQVMERQVFITNRLVTQFEELRRTNQRLLNENIFQLNCFVDGGIMKLLDGYKKRDAGFTRRREARQYSSACFPLSFYYLVHDNPYHMGGESPVSSISVYGESSSAQEVISVKPALSEGCSSPLSAPILLPIVPPSISSPGTPERSKSVSEMPPPRSPTLYRGERRLDNAVSLSLPCLPKFTMFSEPRGRRHRSPSAVHVGIIPPSSQGRYQLKPQGPLLCASPRAQDDSNVALYRGSSTYGGPEHAPARAGGCSDGLEASPVFRHSTRGAVSCRLLYADRQDADNSDPLGQQLGSSFTGDVATRAGWDPVALECCRSTEDPVVVKPSSSACKGVQGAPSGSSLDLPATASERAPPAAVSQGMVVLSREEEIHLHLLKFEEVFSDCLTSVVNALLGERRRPRQPRSEGVGWVK